MAARVMALMAVVIAVEAAIVAIAVIPVRMVVIVGVAAAVTVMCSVEVIAPMRSVAITAMRSPDISTRPVAGKSRSAEASAGHGVAAKNEPACTSGDGDADNCPGEHRRLNSRTGSRLRAVCRPGDDGLLGRRRS